MKKILVVLVLSVISSLSVAQDVTLTKGETVAYLDKKFKEIIGHKDPQSPEVFLDAGVKFENSLLIIKYTLKLSETTSWSFEFNFNPMYIKDVHTAYDDEEVPMLSISLLTSCGKEIIRHSYNTAYPPKWESTSSSKMYFLKGDNKNGEKCKKALLHLQALLKAEDDPFGT